MSCDRRWDYKTQFLKMKKGDSRKCLCGGKLVIVNPEPIQDRCQCGCHFNFLSETYYEYSNPHCEHCSQDTQASWEELFDIYSIVHDGVDEDGSKLTERVVPLDQAKQVVKVYMKQVEQEAYQRGRKSHCKRPDNGDYVNYDCSCWFEGYQMGIAEAELKERK